MKPWSTSMLAGIEELPDGAHRVEGTFVAGTAAWLGGLLASILAWTLLVLALRG